ncbi:MAG: hypothetical protein M3539_01870 [Acidobacteriota bacterium]|nr:hypothetical protein [Acidobacteriota bacterium]
MLTDTFHSIAVAARKVFRNWHSMLLLAVVYGLLLGALYLFVIIREASLAQVTLTFVLAVAAPLLFFLLQAMIASDGDELPVSSLVRKSLANFWKLIVVTLPLIAVAVLVAYLLGKAQARFGATVPDAAAEIPRRLATAANPSDAARPIDWRAALLSTVRYLTFGLLLPLAAIHFWVATARDGLGTAIRKLATLLARAFAPQSVLIYIVGFIIFGVVPYFLLFRTTPTKYAWLEIFFLVARLAAVFALTLFGWVITVKALALSSTNTVTGSATEAT